MKIRAKSRITLEMTAEEARILGALMAKVARPSAGFTRLNFTEEEKSLAEGLADTFTSDGDGEVDLQ